MKTGKITILITAGVFFSLMLLALLTLRSDMKRLMENNAVRQYQSYETGMFSKISCSSHWHITVRQGNKWRLEVSSNEEGILPKWDNSEGILKLGMETINPAGLSGEPDLYARITLPYLELIEARGNTRIEMKNYWSDSLTVRLGGSAQFSGKNNDITLIKFKTANE